MNKKATIALAALMVGILSYLPSTAHALLGSDCRLLDMQTVWTDGYIFTIHYITSGHIKNVGWLPSGQIQLRATFTTADTGAVLWTTYFNPVPASLGAGESGIYSIPFSGTDIGGYTAHTLYGVKVISQ